MDKQKQIEEMAEIALKNTLSYTCAKQIAMNFYNAGYRKIPENAVVLTGTKAEEHFVDLLTEFDEMGFHPETTVPYPMVYADEWKRRMLYAIGQLRKETVDKFAERLKESLDISVEGYSTSEVINEIEDKIDEICKEITEGKV